MKQSPINLGCFKAYDIRGKIPSELNENIAYRIGRAYAAYLTPERVIVGKDNRPSSAALCAELARGLSEGGADVFDIGLCGTEEMYHATFSHGMDGGIVVTASHNPRDYNGMKLVREGSRPISGDTGLHNIKELTERGEFPSPQHLGDIYKFESKVDYVEHLLKYVDTATLRPLKVVVNPGNGCAGPIIDLLEPHLPFEFIRIHDQPDGTFPNGIPNPLLPENRDATAAAVIASGADIGIAWDGDFDRCFLFDETGNFIEGYYVVGMLSNFLLAKNPGARIIHDPRLTWNTIDIVRGCGGVPVQCKTGHAFIKERMRAEDAIYGGEMSAHHYFKAFAYCDSGMIPWLMVVEIMSRLNKRLSSLVVKRMDLFPASGEINCTLNDPVSAMIAVEKLFFREGATIDRTDGLSMEFDKWRFNLRLSNTEPVIRLNVETRGDRNLLSIKTNLLLDHLYKY